MKQLFSLLFFCLSLSLAQGHDGFIGRGPVELNKVSNLLKWSDFVVVAVQDELGNGLVVEEVILNKRTEALKINQAIRNWLTRQLRMIWVLSK